MKPKKIIHIIPAIKIGGVEKLVLSSVKEINKAINYQVLVIGEVDKKLWKSLPYSLRSCIIINKSGNWILGFFKTLRIIKRLNPDVVITSLWKSALIVRLIHNPSFYHIGFIHNTKGAHFVDRNILRWQIKNSKFLIADSNAAHAFIRSINSSVVVKILPLFFPPNINFPNKTESLVTRFCFVGRIYKYKGIDLTIRLIELLHKKKVLFEFDFYGPDEGELHKIEDLIKQLPFIKVTYKGIITPWEVNEVLSNYHFLVQLSDHEGMAMSVVEAMQCGVVPIVTAVGEIKTYGKHLSNSIILNKEKEKGLEDLVEILEGLILNKENYKRLSNNAIHTFDNAPDYITNMINILKRV